MPLSPEFAIAPQISDFLQTQYGLLADPALLVWASELGPSFGSYCKTCRTFAHGTNILYVDKI